MSNARFNQITSAVLGSLDRKTLGGVFLGVAIMASTMATGGPTSSASWFSSLFSTGTSGSSASSSLISTQDSVIAAQIQTEANDCGNATTPGTIGNAIATAMQAHSEIASATPNVESLFDINSNCFAGIGQIYDLSFAIPSLASILSAAQSALLAYAQKKVCTAVNQVSGMVTTPLNGAIAKVNTLSGFTNINGMANGAVSGAMNTIDPQLGAQYHAPVASGTYTVGSSFGTGQTTFTGTGSSGSTSTLQNQTTQINTLTQQIANQHIAVNQAQMNLQAAQTAYSNCMSWWGSFGSTSTTTTSCPTEAAAVTAAQTALTTQQTTLANLQTQLTQITTQTAQVTTGPATVTTGPAPSTSFFGNLFTGP